MKPIRIETKGKGFFKMILMWLLGVRHWEITKDFTFSLEGKNYIIPAGFTFDGASIPKFLHMFLSPVGVLLIGGLIHDYAYKYETLLEDNKKDTIISYLKRSDQIFRDINIEVNDFYLMNYLNTLILLRLMDLGSWNKHRKVNAKI